MAELADRYGQGRIRTTADQKLVVLDVPDDSVEDLVAALAEHDLQVRPRVFRRATMACTGIEFCKLAIVEIKGHAKELTAELERRLPDFDEPITINVNGCPNSCARFQTADIGFKGMMVVGEEGFQIHLGVHLGIESSIGRKLRGHKVAATETAENRTDGERFAAYAARADEDWLR